MTLNTDVRERLDAHLDAVEKALVEARCPRERRRGIVDDLEAQVMDMLAARTPEPALADLEAVLATLDPPAAYGENAPPVDVADKAAATAVGSASPPMPGTTVAASVNWVPTKPLPGKPKLSGMAVAGLVCILLSKIFFAVAFSFFAVQLYTAFQHTWLGRDLGFQPDWPAQPIVLQMVDGQPQLVEHATPTRIALAATVCALVVPVPLAIIGTLLGWMALGRIRASNGALYGRGLALFDGLCYPAICGMLFLAVFPIPISIPILAALVVLVILLANRTPARA